MFNNIDIGSSLVGLFGLTILLLWEIVLIKKHKIFQMIQGPLVAVIVGIIFFVLTKNYSAFTIDNSFLVNVPVPKDFNSFLGQFTFPNFNAISNPEIWVVAFTIALVASLETILCVESTDKLDPEKKKFLQGKFNKEGGMGKMDIMGFEREVEKYFDSLGFQPSDDEEMLQESITFNRWAKIIK